MTDETPLAGEPCGGTPGNPGFVEVVAPAFLPGTAKEEAECEGCSDCRPGCGRGMADRLAQLEEALTPELIQAADEGGADTSEIRALLSTTPDAKGHHLQNVRNHAGSTTEEDA